MGKVSDNKQKKRESLLDSAFSLFIDNGFNKTSISDIVSNAGVAKGTFYLYFKDKYDIRNHLIAHQASKVFQLAYNDLLERPEISDFEDQVLFLADHILNQFEENRNLVMLLSKHLSWGFFKDTLYFTMDTSTPSILTTFSSLLQNASYTYRQPEMMMYLILEILSGTSYNAILYQQPTSMEEMKPILFETVRNIMKQFREDTDDSADRKYTVCPKAETSANTLSDTPSDLQTADVIDRSVHNTFNN